MFAIFESTKSYVFIALAMKSCGKVLKWYVPYKVVVKTTWLLVDYYFWARIWSIIFLVFLFLEDGSKMVKYCEAACLWHLLKCSIEFMSDDNA